MSHVVNCPCCGSLLSYDAILGRLEKIAATNAGRATKRRVALTDAGRAVVAEFLAEQDAAAQAAPPRPAPWVHSPRDHGRAAQAAQPPADFGGGLIVTFPAPPSRCCPHGRNTFMVECTECASGMSEPYADADADELTDDERAAVERLRFEIAEAEDDIEIDQWFKSAETIARDREAA